MRRGGRRKLYGKRESRLLTYRKALELPLKKFGDVLPATIGTRILVPARSIVQRLKITSMRKGSHRFSEMALGRRATLLRSYFRLEGGPRGGPGGRREDPGQTRSTRYVPASRKKKKSLTRLGVLLWKGLNPGCESKKICTKWPPLGYTRLERKKKEYNVTVKQGNIALTEKGLKKTTTSYPSGIKKKRGKQTRQTEQVLENSGG